MAEEKNTDVSGKSEDTEKKEDSKTAEKEAKKKKNASIKKDEEKKIPKIKPGMTVRVYQKIKEKTPKGEIKERVQYFEGMVLAVKHGQEAGASITVRKISDGVGVEKIFPLHLPTITKIEIKKQARVRRAKLYFLKKGYKKKLKTIRKKK